MNGTSGMPRLREAGPRVTAREARPAELLLRGAHLLDPRARIDGRHDLLVRAGRIAEIRRPARSSRRPEWR